MTASVVTAVEPEYIGQLCGHSTKAKGEVTAFGRTITTEMPVRDGQVEYCLACIAGMAIKCAWCGRPIFIGDPVTLYRPDQPNFVVPEGAVVYRNDPLQVVGCLGWDCADTGADRAGFWLPGPDGKGRVERMPTMFEHALASAQPVAVSDLSDMNEAMELPATPASDGNR